LCHGEGAKRPFMPFGIDRKVSLRQRARRMRALPPTEIA
jgi:hypothetical protein